MRHTGSHNPWFREVPAKNSRKGVQENSTIVAATCFHAPDAMKEPPCGHPHGGSFINTIRKTLRPPQTLPADGKTGKQVILPISRPPACHAGSESRAGKESPLYKPAIPVHLPPENGDARHHTGPAQTGSGHRQSFRKVRRNPPCAPSGQAPEYGHRHPGGGRLPPFPPPSGLQPDNRKRRQIKRSYPVFL